jgi:hypothetical protein
MPHTGPLRTARAIVARESEPAVVAAVLLLAVDISHGITLPMPETLV